MRLVDAAIRRGDFEYQAFFPRGSRLQLFHPDPQPDGLMTFENYVLRWQRLRSPFRGDGTVARDADLHPSTWLHDESTIRRHLVPAFGRFSLREVDVARVNEFRRRLVADGLTGKSVSNIIGVLHKVMSDATEEGFISSNPVRRIRSGRRRRVAARIRSQSDPLTPSEIAGFLAAVPSAYRMLYNVWFRVGWRSSEMMALRFCNLDFARQIITVDTRRLPRFGGIEAEPKTGPREVDCSYDPQIFALLVELRNDRDAFSPDDYVFTDPSGAPRSHEWRHERVWLPTLERAGFRRRGQYNIRDSFISIALSAGEDPGWVAKVCGTSEEMIFRHYRTWIPGLNPGAGSKVGRILGGGGGGNLPLAASPVCPQDRKRARKRSGTSYLREWRRGESNPRPKARERVVPSDQDYSSPRNSDDDHSGPHQE